MDNLKPLDALNLNGDIAENWRRWKQRRNLFVIASGAHKKSENIQCATFLHMIGEDALNIYDTFTFTDNEGNKIEILIDKFEEHFSPQKNITYQRYLFNTCSQNGRPFDDFLIDLRNKARTCEFENLQDSLIRDRIVCGIDDKNIRERLLRDNNLTLDRATAIVKASETSKSQVHELDGKNIDAIRKQNSHHKQNNYQNQTPMRKSPQIPKKSHPNNNITSAISNNFSKQTKSCYYCGTKHGRLCTAFGQQCSKCRKSNHFARVCQSSSFNANPQQIHEIEQQSNKFAFNPNYKQPFIPSANQLDINELFIDHVSNSNKTSSQNEILSKLDVNDQFIEFKIDSGAQCNIIPIHIFNQIKNKPPIQNSNTILRTYGGNTIPFIGVCTMTVKFQHKTVNALFYIVNVNNTKPLMGFNSSQDLNIITISTVESDNKSKNNSILQQYDNIFKGLGKADGEYTIKLSENAKPTIYSPRKVPLTVLPKLKETLDRLENAGVITKLDHPTEWVNSLVIVKKKRWFIETMFRPK